MLSSKLISLVADLDYIKEFKQAEAALRAEKSLWEDYEHMKALQKEAVMFNKLDKPQAFRETSQQAQRLEKSLKTNPLVKKYLSKMEDVNDLLQHITGEIEQKVNEGLGINNL